MVNVTIDIGIMGILLTSLVIGISQTTNIILATPGRQVDDMPPVTLTHVQTADIMSNKSNELMTLDCDCYYCNIELNSTEKPSLQMS